MHNCSETAKECKFKDKKIFLTLILGQSQQTFVCYIPLALEIKHLYLPGHIFRSFKLTPAPLPKFAADSEPIHCGWRLQKCIPDPENPFTCFTGYPKMYFFLFCFNVQFQDLKVKIFWTSQPLPVLVWQLTDKVPNPLLCVFTSMGMPSVAERSCNPYL